MGLYIFSARAHELKKPLPPPVCPSSCLSASSVRLFSLLSLDRRACARLQGHIYDGGGIVAKLGDVLAGGDRLREVPQHAGGHRGHQRNPGGESFLEMRIRVARCLPLSPRSEDLGPTAALEPLLLTISCGRARVLLVTRGPFAPCKCEHITNYVCSSLVRKHRVIVAEKRDDTCRHGTRIFSLTACRCCPQNGCCWLSPVQTDRRTASLVRDCKTQIAATCNCSLSLSLSLSLSPSLFLFSSRHVTATTGATAATNELQGKPPALHHSQVSPGDLRGAKVHVLPRGRRQGSAVGRAGRGQHKGTKEQGDCGSGGHVRKGETKQASAWLFAGEMNSDMIFHGLRF